MTSGNLVAFTLTAMTGCGVFDWGPADVPPEETCDFTPFLTPPEFTDVPTAPLCIFDDVPDTLPCNCEDYDTLYGGQVPPGVFDPGAPGSAFPGDPGAGDPDLGFEAQPGCNAWIWFAAPWCAQQAQLSGRIEHTGGGGADDDLSADVCPIRESMYTVDQDRRVHPQELRSYPSFGVGPDIGGVAMVQGRIHAEWQMCRQYQGGYQVPAERDATGNITRTETFNDVQPQPGDYFAGVGDWVVDAFCDGPITFGHECKYSELHETRGMATIRPDPGDPDNRHFAFLSAILTDVPRRDRAIFFDMVIPPSPDPTRTKLLCTWEDAAVADRDCGFQQPNRRHSAFRQESMAIDIGGRLACPVEFRCDTAQCTYGRADWHCCSTSIEQGAFCPCDGNQWASIYGSDTQRACDTLLYAGVMTTEWRDPGDVWVCHNCGCADLAAPGASIAAPVQGCVPPGLDPTNPAHQQQVCDAICPGREMCGGAPACEIGLCQPPSGGAFAELVVEHACDPELVLPGSASPAADYLVQLQSSKMTAFDGSDSITRDVHGVLYLNAANGVLDIAAVRGSTPDFETHGQSVTELKLANSGRIIGQLDGPPFQIPQGLGVFVLRLLVNGELKGAEFQNPERIDGTFDPTSGVFTAEVHAVRPQTEERVRLDALLRGIVVNGPPIADASDSPVTVECQSHSGSLVILDAGASSDPDVGDSISHVQWFRPTGEGLGNLPQQPVQFPLGSNPYRLHVYDAKLGSDLTTGEVDVVDTIPPTLDLEPQEFCIWPPNHKRVRFRLGDDFHASATDICDPTPTVRIVGVTSDEPDDGLGDGSTTGDATFSDTSVCIHRERSGLGDGRTYTVTVEASDDSGNATTRDLRILVPHAQSSHQGCRSSGVVIAEGEPCD